jgi:hypothetical protein
VAALHVCFWATASNAVDGCPLRFTIQVIFLQSFGVFRPVWIHSINYGIDNSILVFKLDLPQGGSIRATDIPPIGRNGGFPLLAKQYSAWTKDKSSRSTSSGLKMFAAPRTIRYLAAVIIVLTITASLFLTQRSINRHGEDYMPTKIFSHKKQRPYYLPEPKWKPPPVVDPFESLKTSPAPAVPEWNLAPRDLYKDYNLDYPPPLFIGFTRGWPLLIQAVVSYITAGWPAENIYVVENTGTQWANSRGKLTLQNPFYLDYARLEKLGVNIIQTPVLLTFSQLQNFYLHLAHEHDWPQYFWSHMDVLAQSWEDGSDGRPKPREEGYKSLYKYCIEALSNANSSDDAWGLKFFAYDHLTLVNRVALDDVGGWDVYIPFYITDCDMHNRFAMKNWTIRDERAGIISDVSTTLKDLRALYRDPDADLGFIDPNPPPPTKRSIVETNGLVKTRRETEKREEESYIVKYWLKLRETTVAMENHKQGSRGRNTWQASQTGGDGEPFYYPSRGLSKSFEFLTDAGKRVYEEKWGHQNCELITEGKLKFGDQWKVAHDF